MKKRILWTAWVFVYGICAALSHIAQPQGAQAWAIPAVSVLFFLPPVWLLIDGLREKDGKTLGILRWISGGSVALTTILMIANVLAALSDGKTLGIVLNEALLFVSVPMMSLGNFYISLFLWCCIFFATFSLKNKKK